MFRVSYLWIVLMVDIVVTDYSHEAATVRI